MDGLIIPDVDKLKIVHLISALIALATLENPREAITNIYILKDSLNHYERSPLIRNIGETICEFYLNFYRNYPI